MVRTLVAFEETTYRRAQRLARQRGISFAELCRRAVAQLTAETSGAQPWMRYAGMFESNDAHAGATIDEVVYGRVEP